MVSHLFFICIPMWGDDPIWRAYFSNGLVQPPSIDYIRLPYEPMTFKESHCDVFSFFPKNALIFRKSSHFTRSSSQTPWVFPVPSQQWKLRGTFHRASWPCCQLCTTRVMGLSAGRAGSDGCEGFSGSAFHAGSFGSRWSTVGIFFWLSDFFWKLSTPQSLT